MKHKNLPRIKMVSLVGIVNYFKDDTSLPETDAEIDQIISKAPIWWKNYNLIFPRHKVKNDKITVAYWDNDCWKKIYLNPFGNIDPNSIVPTRMK